MPPMCVMLSSKRGYFVIQQGCDFVLYVLVLMFHVQSSIELLLCNMLYAFIHSSQNYEEVQYDRSHCKFLLTAEL